MSADARRTSDPDRDTSIKPHHVSTSTTSSSSSNALSPSGLPLSAIAPPIPADTALDVPQVEAALISPSSGSLNPPNTAVNRHEQVPGAPESQGRQPSSLDYFSSLSGLNGSVAESNPAHTRAPGPSQIAKNSDRFVEAAREELYGNAAVIEAPSTSKNSFLPLAPIPSKHDASVRPSNTLDATTSRSIPVRSKTLHPQFPNQSLAALHTQFHHPRHPNHFSHNRAASSSQNSLLSPATATTPARQNWLELTNANRVSRTAGNTPAQTPGLSPNRPHYIPIHPLSLDQTLDESSESSVQASPYLHPSQQQPPRTTTSANREVDTFSGRKLINHYEIIDELGRGVHGKVKLARDLETGKDVAIKIVSRHSKRTRLGKAAIPEDKVKKEIAILKKIQHPNVVRLIEVIDDPDIAKVYLVLEFCELKEIQWRHHGYPEIILAEHHRQMAEFQGHSQEEQDATWTKIDGDRRHRRKMEARRKPHRQDTTVSNHEQDSHCWSLEYGGDTDDESYAASEPALPEGTKDLGPEEDSPVQNLNGKPSNLDLRKQLSLGSSGQLDFRRSSSPTVPSSKHMVASNPLQHQPSTSTNMMKANGSEASIGYFDGPRTDGFSFYSTEWYQDSGQQLRGPTLDQIRESRKDSLAASSTTTFTDVYESEIPEESRYVPTMSIPECRVAFRDALVGIEYLHYQGVVHRDIKPENLLRNRDRRVKISDFGVSYLGKPEHKAEDSGEVSETEGAEFDEETALAKTVGTPAYYAPELCNLGIDLDAPIVTGQIDIWALGVTLFCLLFARTPFTAENQFVLMRKITEDEVFIPRARLKAVDPLLRSPGPDGALYAPDKRLADQWKHEPIDDELYDLLRRVLQKDPRKRISIRELKHHPWVLRGLINPTAWLEETEPANYGSGEKIEITHEEVADAVIPIKLVQRIRSITKRATSALGLGGRRRRGQSSAASSETSPIPAQDDPIAERRQSLQPNDPMFSAIKSPREKEPFEHPLATSVTASPTGGATPKESQESFPSAEISPISQQRPSSSSNPLPRPSMPDRQISEMSTTGSIRTVRQSDYPRGRPTSVSPPPAGSERSRTSLDTPIPSSLGILFSNAGRNLLRTLSRDDAERGSSASPQRSSPGSRGRTTSNHHTPNSTTTTANSTDIAAHLHSKLGDSPGSSSTLSGNHSTQELVTSTNTTHTSSPESTRQATPSLTDQTTRQHTSPVDLGGGYSRGVPVYQQLNEDPTEEEYRKAMDDLNRRRRLEDVQDQERLNASRPQSSGQLACPPSPDDVSPQRFQSPGQAPREYFVSRLSSSSTAFSSEDHLVSDQSRSTSNPSVPSIMSADSSTSPEQNSEQFVKVDGSTSSSEGTIHTRPNDSPSTFALQSEHSHDSDDGYAGDGDGDGNGEKTSNMEDADDESSDSDEDFLVLRRHRSKTSGTGSSNRGSSAKQPAVSTSIKTSRSGSSNTMKQVVPEESIEDDTSE